VILTIDFDDSGQVLAERTEELGIDPTSAPPADPWVALAETIVAIIPAEVVQSRMTEGRIYGHHPGAGRAFRRALAVLAHGRAARRLAVPLR